jgi:hypothetical protein
VPIFFFACHLYFVPDLGMKNINTLFCEANVQMHEIRILNFVLNVDITTGICHLSPFLHKATA